MMATILQNQLAMRDVRSLTRPDCEEIIELLIEQLTEMELSLALREITSKPER
ncbi:hypothetical protein [Bradyrhizobium sp. PRIMUS42]|uniref:hypothetical protein n=1 Tax=Bradyrhizobium sp. PRIMUS42 TaxID=2908926 RepID=UPI001FF17AC6|nr:hypothetical protein [Bradyrhizobium sp. PRIMUS42]MCJ9728977.1 hypothetical protein [Bradyrhizobium sp. PRIMUS42]